MKAKTRYKMFPTVAKNEHTAAMFGKVLRGKDLYRKIKRVRYRKQISINVNSFRQDLIKICTISVRKLTCKGERKAS